MKQNLSSVAKIPNLLGIDISKEWKFGKFANGSGKRRRAQTVLLNKLCIHRKLPRTNLKVYACLKIIEGGYVRGRIGAQIVARLYPASASLKRQPRLHFVGRDQVDFTRDF